MLAHQPQSAARERLGAARALRLPVLLALLALLVAAAGPAAEPAEIEEARAILQRLETRYARLPGLRADFLQIWRPGRFAGAVEERGTLWVRPPGMARWQYLEPEPKLALVTPDAETWFYMPSEQQAIHGRLAEPLPPHLALLTGRAGLLEAWNVVEARVGRTPGGIAVIALAPRANDLPYERVLLTLDLDGPALQSLVVTGTGGEQTEYLLSDVEEGVDLPLSLFRFEPPEGTEVLQQGGGAHGNADE